MSREVTEETQVQGTDERIAYTITTTPWGSSPTGVSVVAKTVNIDGTFTDVTATVFPTNSPSVAGDVITLSLLRALTAGLLYRIEVQFTAGGNVYEPYFFVRAET